MKSIRLLVLVFYLCFSSSVVMAIHYEDRGDPWLHTQPNKTTTFMAVQWGLSFLMEYETEDGYTIIQSPSDGYWYYAELDSEGEYAPSTEQVGIDEPTVAKHLRRSPARIAQLQAEVGDIRRGQKTFAERWRDMWARGYNKTLHVAVLLVEFDDREGKKGDGGESHFDSQNLQNMITSQNVYNWDNGDAEFYQTPDEYPTCGSVRDYYNDMTNEEIDLEPVVLDPVPGYDDPRTLLINPLDPDNDDKPIWFEMPCDIDSFRNTDEWYGTILSMCIDENWLPEQDPDDPVYPGFDILMFIFAGRSWLVGEELIFEGYEGRNIPGNGNAGILRATLAETRFGFDVGGDPHLSQVGIFIDEAFDPLAFDLYPFQRDKLNYGYYPRSVDTNDRLGGGFVGGFDNAAHQTGNFKKNNGDEEPQFVGNSGAYWNPRDRIKMGWFGDHIELEEDIAAFPAVLASIDETESQPTFYSYKYVDSYDGPTPIYGQFFLECRRVLMTEDGPYVDFNSKSVGWAGYDDSLIRDEPWRKSGWVPTQNENNLLIWHAEDEGPQIHVQFGDGHAYCTNSNYGTYDEDENPGGLPYGNWRDRDGYFELNGNDYFPSPEREEPFRPANNEFGPGTYQNRATPALDYSSVDLLEAASDLDYRIMQTGFCVKNIVDDQDNDRITCDVYTNYYGGRINDPEDYTLRANNLYLGQNCVIIGRVEIIPVLEPDPCYVILDSDILVTDGGLLYFHGTSGPSSSLMIVNLNGYDIVVEAGDLHGELRIEGDVRIRGPGRVIIDDGYGRFAGTAEAHVQFTSAEAEAAPGDWEGLLFEDLSSSFSLEYVDIGYAVNSIKAVDCGNYLEFDNVTITDFSSTGFNLVNSSPTISNCSASNSEPVDTELPIGLYCYNSSPSITDSDFDNNYGGVQAIGVSSVLSMGHCSMSNNDVAGLDMYDAIGYFYYATGFDYGYNEIIDNESTGGVNATGLAMPYLGYGSYSTGNNSIYNNSSYQIYNATSYEIQAEYNWWGSVNGPDYIYGQVDYDPWLLTAPGSAPPKPGGGGEFIANDEDDANDILVRADSLIARGNLADALDVYREIVEDYQNTTRLLAAVRQMRFCYRELDRRDDWRTLILNLNRNRDIRANYRPFVTSLLAQNEIEQDEPRSALNLISSALRELDRDSEAYPTLLFQLGMIQHYSLDDPGASAETFSMFMEMFGRDHPLYNAAMLEFTSSVRDAEEINAPPGPGVVNEPDVPTEYALFSPYPNPFNQSATIRYAIPEAADVQISLFDIMGRKITDLTNKRHEAGMYRVHVSGSSLESGVYLCRMQSKQFNQTVKLIFLK